MGGHFSELSTTDAERYIDMLRSENNGKLTGLVIQTIYDRVGQFMSADRNKRMRENECSICLENMAERDSRTLKPCSHKFHKQCINVIANFISKRNYSFYPLRTGWLNLGEQATLVQCAGHVRMRKQ